MYNERLLEHFQHPRNVGELAPPAVVVEVTNPACGDILRLSALVADGRIAAVAYKVRGCAASIAVGSALTTLMEGKLLAELPLLTPAELESAVGGLPPASKHAAALAWDGVRALIKAIGQ